MKYVIHTLLLSLSLLAAAGCRSGSRFDLRHKETHAYRPELPLKSATANSASAAEQGVIKQASATESTATGSDSTVQQLSALVPSESSETAIAPTPGMSLEQLISIGLAQNPDLVTLRQSDSVGTGALGVAQTYPFNPFVQFQVTPWQNSKSVGQDTTYHYVLLMQTIQLAHQQQYREQGAACALNSTRWNIHQMELQTLAQTERLYFTVLYQHGIMKLAEASDRNNRQLLRILENQLDAGQATAADVAIVRVDAASTRQQLQLASANYQTSVRDLAQQTGMSPVYIRELDGDLTSILWKIPGSSRGVGASSVDGDLTSEIEAARSTMPAWASSRPDVMAARSDIDVARAGLNLATASKTPDLQIGPYYQTTADGTNFFGLRGQIDLPVINNGQPLENQRSAEHRQRLTAWRQAVRRAELEAEAAFERYETALTAAAPDSDFDGTELPAALEGLERQFLEGEVDIIRVVQARASLIQNQRARLDLLNEVAQSAATLTGTTGIPVEQILEL